MSMYDFTPASEQHEHFAYWNNGFTPSDCKHIIEVGEKKELTDGHIGLNWDGSEVGRVDYGIRIAKTSWLEYSDLPEIYGRLAYIVRSLNGKYFGFDVTGFYENFQYTVYTANPEAKTEGFYDWHIDEGYSSMRPPRKLTVVMQLSDPSEYEGGQLQLNIGGEPIVAGNVQGHVFVFPSFYLHQVTPVTKGTRRSLVTWVTGPRFR